MLSDWERRLQDANARIDRCLAQMLEDEGDEEDEEEAEEMDNEEQPSRFPGISGPGIALPPFSVVVTAGGARRVRSRTRTTSSTLTCGDDNLQLERIIVDYYV